jgi:methyl-accepting chemotaxis protein/hemerythrin
MPLIKWSEDLQIGIEGIDAQHRYLINIINELHLAVEYGSGNETILPLIERLHEYADTHFKAEEALFEEHDFPGKVDHAQEHHEFIVRLDELKSQYSSKSDVLTINIRNFLLSWFFHHIRINDMEYKLFLEQKREEVLSSSKER